MEVVLPLSTFTFRPFESLLYTHSGLGYPFYPNHRLAMRSKGDLCSNSRYAVFKEEVWVTDELGYRNNKVLDSADVIVIGDSFIYGTAATQDSIFSSVMQSLSGDKIKCYNLSPATLDEFILLTKGGFLNVPKVIIMSKVERDIPRELGFFDGRTMHKPSFTSVIMDKAGRFYSLKYLNAKIFTKNESFGKQSSINPEMFFLTKKVSRNQLKMVPEVVETITEFRDYCNSIGVEFIYLPAPNKETIYFREAGISEQPPYIEVLHKELSARNIACVNTVRLFNQYRSIHSNMLYHYDDTHWNATGIRIAAQECLRVIDSLVGHKMTHWDETLISGEIVL
jgi:alginate O-acetyltransferase complex protein AlgJ